MMIKNFVKKIIFQKKWRKNNKDNFTRAGNVFDASLVSVGKKSYGFLNVFSSSNGSKLKIGSYCSIGAEVMFVINNEHYLDHFSTYPFKVKLLGEKSESFSKGDIVVDDDVWIGNRAMILSGVHIGKGAVVAAGAIVTHDVPPYAIVGGVPAKVIRYRFEKPIIDQLMTIDMDKIDDEFFVKHIENLYKPIEKESDLNWLKNI